MLIKFKCILLCFLFLFIAGCSKEDNDIVNQINNDNKYKNALEYQINDDMIAKFPNYTFDNSNGVLISKTNDMNIKMYYFVGIDKMFSKENLSILLDNQLTSMDDSGAIKFGYMVESMVIQILSENQIDFNSYEKEWLSGENYDCFRLKNLKNNNGLCSDIIIYHDIYNDGVIAFLFQYEKENEYLINDFIEAIEFSKDFKIKKNYKNELDIIYPDILRIEIEVDQYGNIIQ